MEIPQTEIEQHEGPPLKSPSTVKTESEEPVTDAELFFKNYRLHQNFFTKEDLQKSPTFRIIRGKNYQYFGEFVDHLKHGFGILIAGDTAYEGEFRLNFKMGKGYLKYSSGAVYLGDFVNSKPHGNGTFVYPSKQTYIGQFQNGLIHGNGMWKSPKGDRYIGEWRNNKADGYGIHIWVNGDTYEGQFKQFLKHGYGVEKFANGDSYKGFYEGGKPNGYGQYTWHNGSVFKGEFKAGLRHGKGVWKKSNDNGDSYQGLYQNDKKCGYGVFQWSSGNVYKGQFFDDLRHGQGEMHWSDGSYYIGSWEKGLQHGRGTIRFIGTPERTGIFQNNVLVMEQPAKQDQVQTNPLLATKRKKHSHPHNPQVQKILSSFYEEPQKLQNLQLVKTKKHNSHSCTRTNRFGKIIPEEQPLQIYKNVWNPTEIFFKMPVTPDVGKQRKRVNCQFCKRVVKKL